jgi:hypothetical protein
MTHVISEGRGVVSKERGGTGGACCGCCRLGADDGGELAGTPSLLAVLPPLLLTYIGSGVPISCSPVPVPPPGLADAHTPDVSVMSLSC